MLLTLKSKYWLEIIKGEAHSNVMSETFCLKQIGRSGSLQFNNSTVQVTTSKYRAALWMSSQIPCPQSPSPPTPTPLFKPPAVRLTSSTRFQHLKGILEMLFTSHTRATAPSICPFRQVKINWRHSDTPTLPCPQKIKKHSSADGVNEKELRRGPGCTMPMK